MNSRIVQNIIAALGLGLAILFGCLIAAKQNWSHPMQRRIGLGFHDQITSPIIALELARTAEQVQDVIGRSLQTQGQGAEAQAVFTQEVIDQAETVFRRDRDSAIGIFRWDYGFLVGYSLLSLAVVLRLRTLAALPGSMVACVLFVLVLTTAVLDVAENFFALRMLDNLQEFSPLMRKASLAKWASSFVFSVLLARQMLRSTSPGAQVPAPALGASWRLAGILLLVGGIAGLIGVTINPILISPGFQFVVAAMLPLLFVWRS